VEGNGVGSRSSSPAAEPRNAWARGMESCSSVPCPRPHLCPGSLSLHPAQANPTVCTHSSLSFSSEATLGMPQRGTAWPEDGGALRGPLVFGASCSSCCWAARISRQLLPSLGGRKNSGGVGAPEPCPEVKPLPKPRAP